jgi:hypothetical protein
MSNKFRRAIGWEQFGGEVFLRLELSKPTIAKVFPGTVGIDESPENAYRRLTDMVMTRAQIYGVLSDPVQAVNSGCTEADLKLLSQALESYPKKERNTPRATAAGGEIAPSAGPGF